MTASPPVSSVLFWFALGDRPILPACPNPPATTGPVLAVTAPSRTPFATAQAPASTTYRSSPPASDSTPVPPALPWPNAYAPTYPACGAATRATARLTVGPGPDRAIPVPPAAGTADPYPKPYTRAFPVASGRESPGATGSVSATAETVSCPRPSKNTADPP